MEATMIVWKHHKNKKHNAFVGKPETSTLCATIYPYDGGFLWEVRERCAERCHFKLVKQGSSKKIRECFAAVRLFLSVIG
jgi:hypothetical protein